MAGILLANMFQILLAAIRNTQYRSIIELYGMIEGIAVHGG